MCFSLCGPFRCPLTRAGVHQCWCSLDNITRFNDLKEIQSEKLESLKRTLVEKRKLKGVSFRCIVFVKQRIAAYILSKHLNMDETCKDYGMSAGFVAARKSKITPSIKVTPGDASRCIEQFRSGDINILVATAVIEEVRYVICQIQIAFSVSLTYLQSPQGFDVPEANVVISYDHLKDTVELAQRFGRARQTTSSLTLMSERRDRPLSALRDVKRQQESIIKDFDPSKERNVARQQQSVRDRHRAAFPILLDTDRCESSPLEVLNMYAAKTKALAKTDYIEAGFDKIFRCKISFSNLLMNIEGKGEGNSKKQSQHLAAASILDQLRDRGRKEYGL